ncbi:DUF418 domain-containing protein [Streptosporangium sp. NPDC050855]|uniref:DUF418 domain-containing protein n=1 Tax=Streptosporangium sp. NPDC050855 TaxID=3366194 RepID=UPI0037B7E194
MTQRRIETLDLLRGIAIAGTLGTNIWIFTDPGGPAQVLNALGTPGTMETLLRFVTNGKFLALLTLLFGIGLELQYRSAARRNAPWPGWYLWRAGLLFVEGLIHYLLIFEFDVLMGYALTSVIVAYLIGRSDRAITIWMVTVGSVFTVLIGLLTAVMLAGGTGAGTAPAPSTLFTTGGYLDQVAARIESFGLYRIEIVVIVPLGIVLFLLGSRLMRAGMFEDSGRGTALRRRLMVAGFAVGVPLNLLTSFAGPGWFLVDRYLLPPLVALGLLGLVATLARRATGAPGVLRRGLTNVGRTALSCYIFQNLVASALCYGWGLGLAARFDDLRPWWVPVAWLVICALFMTLSTLWLRRFERGPVEALWQWAYLAPQRRSKSPGENVGASTGR